MTPQMMFLINFISSMSNLAAQTSVPYQVTLNAKEEDREKELALTTIDKIHRTMDIVLYEMESKLNTEEKRKILQLVAQKES